MNRPPILAVPAVGVLAFVAGCRFNPPAIDAPTTASIAVAVTSTTIDPGPAQATAPTSHVTRPDLPRDILARLTINDRPDSTGYRRDLFMPGGRWQDPDRNGCDARKDALRAQSTPPLTGPRCATTGGHWPLVYVPGDTTNPADVDVDHVVPLANAWRSGARTWPTDRLVAYAADPAVLWVVDDGANQAKGDRGPEQWRPQVRAVWCTYATRYTGIKVTYGLTATSAERDALGQMLDTCNQGG